MSDLYGKWLSRSWDDPEIQALTDRDFRIFVYFTSNEHRTISGCYKLALVTAAHELRLRLDDLELAVFHRLTTWVRYDPRTEEVWVRSLAAVNLDRLPTEPLPEPKEGKKGGDRRLPALQKSVAAIRSAWLRAAWLEHYAAWNAQLDLPVPPPSEAPTLTLLRGMDGASDGPSKPPGGGIEAPSKPVAVAGSSQQSAETVPNGTGAPVESVDQPKGSRADAGRLMPVVRECLYVPDAKPPAGYDDGRDFGILVTLLESGLSASTLEAGLRGVAMMRDAGEFESWTPPIKRAAKITVRMLYNTRQGVVQMIEKASHWYFQHQDQQPARGRHGQPQAIAAVMAGMAR